MYIVLQGPGVSGVDLGGKHALYGFPRSQTGNFPGLFIPAYVSQNITKLMNLKSKIRIRTMLIGKQEFPIYCKVQKEKD
jgi:hypothetical protein